MLAQSSRVQLAFICQINLIQWSWIQLSCLLNVFIPISSAREDEEEGAHKHSSTANVLTRHCGEKAACSSVTNNINDGSVPLSVSFSHPSEPACTIRSQEMAHLDEMWPSLFAPLFPLWHYECLMWKWSTALWRLTGVIHVTPCRILFPWIYSVQQWLFFFFLLTRHNHYVSSECMSKHCGMCTLTAGGGWSHGNTQCSDMRRTVWWVLDNTEGVWHTCVSVPPDCTKYGWSFWIRKVNAVRAGDDATGFKKKSYCM